MSTLLHVFVELGSFHPVEIAISRARTSLAARICKDLSREFGRCRYHTNLLSLRSVQLRCAYCIAFNYIVSLQIVLFAIVAAVSAGYHVSPLTFMKIAPTRSRARRRDSRDISITYLR